MVIATSLGFETRLFKGNLLASFTSIVLNGNLLLVLGWIFVKGKLFIYFIYKTKKEWNWNWKEKLS